jgi:S1-C subfamily serine protease
VSGAPWPGPDQPASGNAVNRELNLQATVRTPALPLNRYDSRPQRINFFGKPLTMTKLRFSHCAVFAITGLLAAASWAALPLKVGDQDVPSLAPLVSEVSPAVVNIATQGTREAQPNPLMQDPFFRRFFGATPATPGPQCRLRRHH